MTHPADSAIPAADAAVPTLAQVISAHRAGQFAAAEEGYRALLTADPEDGEAMHWFGVLASQLGAPDMALELAEAALALRPEDPEIRNTLGNVQKQLGQLPQALARFDEALRLKPDYPEAMYNRGHALRALKRPDEAAEAYRNAIALRPGFAEAHYNLGVALREAGDRGGAMKAFRMYLNLSPEDLAGARLALAALGAAPLPPRADPHYVRTLFDSYAQRFDQHLTETLRYTAPALIADRVDSLRAQLPAQIRAVDLGCGTGLAGAALAGMADLSLRLVGVDASPNMLAQARARGVYAELHAEDLAHWLKWSSAQFDLAVAADVVPYFGEVSALFNAVFARLAPGGLFIFTTEASPDEPTRLSDQLRYAHSAGHLARMLAQAGFRLLDLDAASTREQDGVPVDGWLVAASKPVA